MQSHRGLTRRHLFSNNSHCLFIGNRQSRPDRQRAAVEELFKWDNGHESVSLRAWSGIQVCNYTKSYGTERAVRVLPPGGGRSNWCHIWSTRVSGLYWDDAYLQCRYVCDRQPSGQSQARIATVTDVLSRSVDCAAYHPPHVANLLHYYEYFYLRSDLHFCN